MNDFSFFCSAVVLAFYRHYALLSNQGHIWHTHAKYHSNADWKLHSFSHSISLINIELGLKSRGSAKVSVHMFAARR